VTNPILRVLRSWVVSLVIVSAALVIVLVIAGYPIPLRFCVAYVLFIGTMVTGAVHMTFFRS
jgi:hypothetical protein